MPLVLHGGTGIPTDMIKKAIDLGVSKINVNTECQLSLQMLHVNTSRKAKISRVKDMTHVSFLHLASMQSRLLLKRKWKSSDPLEKPEYDFSPHMREEKGDCASSPFLHIQMLHRLLFPIGSDRPELLFKVRSDKNCNVLYKLVTKYPYSNITQKNEHVS